MRRKRRSPGTWFPMLASSRIVGEDVFAYNLIRPTLDVNVDGTPVLGVVPITFDEPQEPPNANPDTEGLGEFIGNEYIFKRALGSLFVSRSRSVNIEDPDEEDTTGIYVTAGFFVARAGAGTTGDPDTAPIGFFGSSTPTAFQNYSPQAQAAIREPWMWRRSWILGWGQNVDQSASQVSIEKSLYASYPRNNVLYPSGLTGPAVDIKSRRHVRQDERLFFGFGALALQLDENGTTTLNSTVRFDLDIRVFGALVKAKSRGSF